ncbi:HXXXD-type acyl-transferase family protein [Euphorbia peplus]|nr:HXXXD-type acyl-transferase family protein [Euphorbia peplus]
MEVKILFRETIKPSSSTPQHLRNYNLSLLDQLSPPIYIPIILFYPSTPKTSFKEKSDRLRKSLSETLTLFYPLAGRIKSNYHIDCNDKGASYNEAHVTGEMSMILQDPEVPQLEKLLPFSWQEMSSNEEILATQMNQFDCGGMAISICIWHQIADGSAAASFARTWARIASGEATNNFEGMIYDCTSIFPPQNTQSISLTNFSEKNLLSNSTMKRFVFERSTLSSLLEKVRINASGPGRPSRFETVAAVIWGAITNSIGEDETTDVSYAGIIVGLRKRMIPPLPELSLGNILQTSISIANYSKNENQTDYNDLTRKIHESIDIVNNDNVRKIHEGGKYFEFMKDVFENPKLIFCLSSWCRFPFYEVDFGWRKPIWVTTTLKSNYCAIFIDTKDGEGIEAYVTLPKEVMAKFQENPTIRSYTSFNSTI